MQITAADVDRAIATLKRWESSPRVQRRPKAKAEIANIKKVVLALSGRS